VKSLALWNVAGAIPISAGDLSPDPRFVAQSGGPGASKVPEVSTTRSRSHALLRAAYTRRPLREVSLLLVIDSVPVPLVRDLEAPEGRRS
jgi:hypothetical protein